MSDNDKVNTGHHIEDKELIKNARKPEGEMGHQILDRMNRSHESMAQWGVSHFDISEDSKILDIGCGGGRNIERFASQISDNGRVVGIDYSDVSVEKSTELNRDAIDRTGMPLTGESSMCFRDPFLKCHFMMKHLILQHALRQSISGLTSSMI